MTYTTFIRSCRNWEEFAHAQKTVQDVDISYEDAKEACRNFNSNLTDKEKEAGTKMEFANSENF
jgi:hypothetical protein